jgi:DnaJ family protein C protein 7
LSGIVLCPLAGSNPLYFTNRALCLQKLDKWDEALMDARYAVELDVDLLKAYIIVIKCQVKLMQISEVESTINSVPLAHQKRPELVEQRAVAAVLAKDIGNNCLKEGDIEGAIAHYSTAIRLDDSSHIYYSNRSAAYQSKKQWKEAATDAEEAVRRNEQFPKGYLHWSRSLIQLRRYKEALTVVEKAKIELAKCGELAGVQAQLSEISGQISAGLSGAAAGARRMPDVNDSVRAEAFKKKGNESYKEGEYQDAVRFYSQAIAAMPGDGSYYGNRAASWLMMKEFKRACEDCVEGLKLEKKVGELDKLRLRHANALAQMGRVDEAIGMLEGVVDTGSGSGSGSGSESTVFGFGAKKGTPTKSASDDEESEEEDSDDEEDEDEDEEEPGSKGSAPSVVRSDKDLIPFREQLQNLRTAKANVELAKESLSKREFSRAKRLIAIAQTGGLADEPMVRLLSAKAHLGLGELEDSSREAQKVIAACGPGGNGGLSSVDASALLLEAYVVRGEALSGLGVTEQAQKYYAAALQLDPDNQEVGRKLKTLRRVVAETARIRGEIDKATAQRKLEAVIGFCTEGLAVDKDSKKLMTEMHLKRARAYQALAKSQLRQAQAAPCASSSSKSTSSEGSATATVTAEDWMERAGASWRKCLSDGNSVLYYDNDSADGVAGCLLKADALLGLSRFDDCIAELEQYIQSIKGKGVDPSDLKEKLDEAKLLLKKSKRKDLYAILGVTKGALATEAELKTAYKKSALKWHPDRHSGKHEDKKQEAETKFKEIGDAFELLSDPVKKRLYDQGHDREEIDQRAEYENQRGGRGGHGHSHGGHGGHGGFGGFGGFY